MAVRCLFAEMEDITEPEPNSRYTMPIVEMKKAHLVRTGFQEEWWQSRNRTTVTRIFKTDYLPVIEWLPRRNVSKSRISLA